MSRRRLRDPLPDRRRATFPSRRAARPSASDTADALWLLDNHEWLPRYLEELQEFLTCERPVPRVDPQFREQLRLDLWWGLIVQRAGGGDRLPRA